MITALVPILRAAAQALVGAGLAYLAAKGLDVPADVEPELVLALTAVLTGVLAKAQHLIEARVPALGAKLHSPAYPTPAAPVDFAALEQALRELGLIKEGIDPETGERLPSE